VSDHAIREYARKHRREDAQRQHAASLEQERDARRAAVLHSRVPRLWLLLGQSLAERADAYNAEYGQSALSAEVRPLRITLRAQRMGHVLALTLAVDTYTGFVLSRIQEVDLVGTRSERDGPDFQVVATDSDAHFASSATGERLMEPSAVANAVITSILEAL
jgi:hypothetical protein